MKLDEYLKHLQEEWAFHKKHPEMFIVWAIYIWSAYILVKEAAQ